MVKVNVQISGPPGGIEQLIENLKNLDVILFLIAIGLLFYAVIFDEEEEE